MIVTFALLAPLILAALWRSSPVAGVLILAVSHALILYPTLRPNSQWLGPVVTHFEPNGNEVWLTIDDGPTDDTPALLDLLDRCGVRATFFVKGALAAAYPELIEAVVSRGHTVANHSYDHPSATFWCALPGRIAAEIDRCNRVLAGHATARWFRAPVGMKNPFVHPALVRREMRLIGWTIRGFDAVVGDAEAITRRIAPLLRAGAILVLHQGRPHSLRVIERVIRDVQSRGYTFVVPGDAQLRADV